MHQATPEVIRVGVSGARIVRVTHEFVEYIDMTGQVQSLDLEQCATDWVKWKKENKQSFLNVSGASEAEIDAWDARTVGTRGALDDPPWVEFMNERRTRFEFETYEALCAELRKPLGDAGWFTFDMD